MVPFVDRSILNPVSLFARSIQDKLIWLDDAAAAARFVGAMGVGAAVGVAEGVGVGVGVDPATKETSFDGGPSTSPLL